MRFHALVLVALVSCTKGEPRASVTTSAATTTTVAVSAAPLASASASASAAAKRCLPVVAAACGCVYTCGTGTEVSPGKWSVMHPVWAPHPLDAKIAPWCVDGDCTDAFHGEIVCSGICMPKKADHTCHFEGDRCVSAAKP